MLDNDNKSCSAMDVLTLCQLLNFPMALDIHHHMWHNNGKDLTYLLPGIVNIWGNHVPKIHVSSPRFP